MGNSTIQHIEWIASMVVLIGGFYLLDAKIERQGERTNHLYELYCQQQSYFDQRFNEMQMRTDQKFYDLLKEMK